MSKYKTQEEAEAAGVYVRKVQSFVKREGRLTKGQAAAIETYWPTMGIDYQPDPINLSDVFGNDNPVVLEIGFGMGQSLVEMAQKDLNKNFIGIEVHTPGVGACLAAAAEAELTNLRVMEHDAVAVLKNMIPDGSLGRVQLYFPDPWHKKRHHKRRIVQAEFVQLLRQKLSVDGFFHMATDWENYAEHMLEVMQQQDGYQNTSETNDYVPRPDFRPLTKFEQRGHRLGHGVWDLIYRKTN